MYTPIGQALLINSANLMGGSSEPDESRGFGRVHLAPGMPLGGGTPENPRALFVADAVAHNTSTSELAATDYPFRVDCAAGVDFRATLSWIDPPASALSAVQLLHDLDLAVFSPTGVRYSMWHSGETDSVNVNERVVVPVSHLEQYRSNNSIGEDNNDTNAATAAAAGDEDNDDYGSHDGIWIVRVWSKRLTVETQAYSLVVTGAISPVWYDHQMENEGEGAVPAASATSWSVVDSWTVRVVLGCWLLVVTLTMSRCAVILQ